MDKVKEAFLKLAKDDRDAALRKAEQLAHEYFKNCEVGDERIKAGEIYNNIRNAARVY